LATVHAVLPLLVLVAACKPPPDERHAMPRADPAHGRAVMERVGCGSCHRVPGVWPEGKVGPPLAGFADQSLIAGRLPNRPDVLAAFVRDAPAMVPGSTMPAMPITPEEARDVAAYLYTLEDGG
jgi:mono/diheme cytochrome c family protein